MPVDYVIVGGGLAAASAIEGIRAHDRKGSILLVSRENHLPYHRPPLSKDLWFGKTTKDKIPVYDDAFYQDNGVELAMRREIVELDSEARRIWDDHGTVHEYGRLLLATGGRPRRLAVEGAELAGIHYYRDLEDYLFLESRIGKLSHVLVVGGGFIGAELAAAMRHAGLEVTLLYPEEYPLKKVLPRDLGLFVADYYREKGVEAVSGEVVARFESHGDEIVAMTAKGSSASTQLVLIGIGIEPETHLADAAGLLTGSGIDVDEFGHTSNQHIFAAGDVAEFPCIPLEKRMRVEHWDHAKQHGRAVGANMAGANQPYTHLPMFYSDLFDLGWEAVGDIDSSLETQAVWKEEFREGMVFYLEEERIRGVLLWNVWEKVDWARDLIREGKPMSHEEREALAKS